MADEALEKQKLLNRLKRMRGRVEAIERSVEADPRRCAAEDRVAVVQTYLT